MFCDMITGGAAEALVFPIGECKVPEGTDGPGQSSFDSLFLFPSIRPAFPSPVICDVSNSE